MSSNSTFTYILLLNSITYEIRKQEICIENYWGHLLVNRVNLLSYTFFWHPVVLILFP